MTRDEGALRYVRARGSTTIHRSRCGIAAKAAQAGHAEVLRWADGKGLTELRRELRALGLEDFNPCMRCLGPWPTSGGRP